MNNSGSLYYRCRLWAKQMCSGIIKLPCYWSLNNNNNNTSVNNSTSDQNYEPRQYLKNVHPSQVILVSNYHCYQNNINYCDNKIFKIVRISKLNNSLCLCNMIYTAR